MKAIYALLGISVLVVVLYTLNKKGMLGKFGLTKPNGIATTKPVAQATGYQLSSEAGKRCKCYWMGQPIWVNCHRSKCSDCCGAAVEDLNK